MKVPLHEIHESMGAKYTLFAGYQLPLYYTSITNEHLSVRNNVGIFDVSHMGRILVEGEDVQEYLNYVLANDINNLYVGRMHYSLILNENAGIIDDITVFMLDEYRFLLVVNAINRLKVVNWLNRHKVGYAINIKDVTRNSIMLAIQGPRSSQVYREIYNKDFDIKRFHFIESGVLGEEKSSVISRSGYTGEDGFEIIYFFCDKGDAFSIWRKIYGKVEKFGGLACGLGARDMLRIEAGYVLYDNDIDEDINPYEASLDWVVKLNKPNFIGKKTLISSKYKIWKKRYGLVMIEPGIPRRGYKIYKEESVVGYVTSGGYSPILKKGIGMVYIDIRKINEPENREVNIDIRGKLRKAVIKKFPLYDIKKYGYGRIIR